MTVVATETIEETENAEESGVMDEIHQDLRDKLLDLRADIDSNTWEMAAVLSHVSENHYYIAWGYKTFRAYITQELDFALRKAQYLVSIAQWFGRNVTREDVIEKVKRLGWSKAKELVEVINDDNADRVLSEIEGMNTVQIVLYAREFLAKLKAPEGEEGESEKVAGEVFRRTFTLTGEQKGNVDEALVSAANESNSDNNGHNLDLICTSFLAGGAGSGQKMTDFLDKAERLFGVKIVAFNEDLNLCFGADTLQSVIGSDG